MGNGTCGALCPHHGENQPEIISIYAINLEEESSDHLCPENSLTKPKLSPIMFDDPDDLLGEEETAKGFSKQNIENSPLKIQQSQQPSVKHVQLQQEKSPLGKMVMISIVGLKGDFGEEKAVMGADDFQPISVPFSVIKLTLSPALIQNVNDWDYNFLESNLKKDKLKQNWKLIGQGCYANLLKPDFGSFFTEKYMYFGYAKRIPQKNSFYLPCSKGIYITENGIYQGSFDEGEASGNGKLAIGDTVYKGEWENGSLLYGTVDCPKYIFHGAFKDNIPLGDGKLKLKGKGVTYQGKFKAGLFHDDNALYECDEYTYKGGFAEGRKNGQGTLSEKEKVQKNQSPKKDKKKYRPPLKLKGIWKDDAFLKKSDVSNKHHE